MNSPDWENDHPASFSLCPMRLSRGNVTPYPGQDIETRVAGLEQTSGGAGKGVLHSDIPYSSEKGTKQGSEQCGKV